MGGAAAAAAKQGGLAFRGRQVEVVFTQRLARSLAKEGFDVTTSEERGGDNFGRLFPSIPQQKSRLRRVEQEAPLFVLRARVRPCFT